MGNLAGQNKPRKSENQIVVRCKHPIKIEKPLQSLLPIYYRVGERNILQTVLFSFFFFFSFYFLNALQSDNNGNTVYVLGHKYILRPPQSSF